MMFCSDLALDEGHVYVVLGEGEEPVEDVQSALTRKICHMTIMTCLLRLSRCSLCWDTYSS